MTPLPLRFLAALALATFGTGDYPRLSWGLENRISSGRRIHGYYPYNTTPNWSAPR